MSVDLNPINPRSKTVKYFETDFETDSGAAPGGPARYHAGRDFEHRAASAWFGRRVRMPGLGEPVEAEDSEAVLSAGKIEEKNIRCRLFSDRWVRQAETGPGNKGTDLPGGLSRGRKKLARREKIPCAIHRMPFTIHTAERVRAPYVGLPTE